MMRNEDFSEGYFSGRLWASVWNGDAETFAADVKEAIDTAILGTLDRRFWAEGFCYGAKAERREQLTQTMSANDGDSDNGELPAESRLISASYSQSAVAA